MADISDRPPFEDRSQLAGIAAIHDGSREEYSSRNFDRGYLAMGQACGDYDNDGWPDLYVTGGLEENTLYHNNGDGTFSISPFNEDVSLPDVWSGGAVWVDYDNDGQRDLYVLANGANVLLHNDGAGFTDVTALAGAGDTGKGSVAAWGDYDDDGWLDLYVVNWSCFPDCNPIDHNLASDRLYHNQGDGTFTAVSRLMDEEKLRGAGFAASFADFDNDGDLDIYVVNDKLQNSIGNVLWRNDGPGCGGWCFSERAAEMGANIVKHGMGLAVADYDNDLDLDIYFSDMVESMALLENRGTAFDNVAEEAEVAVSTGSAVGWGTAFFDFDNDGWQDIFMDSTFRTPSAGAMHLSPNSARRTLILQQSGRDPAHKSCFVPPPGYAMLPARELIPRRLAWFPENVVVCFRLPQWLPMSNRQVGVGLFQIDAIVRFDSLYPQKHD